MRKNFVQILREAADLFARQFEICQIRHIANFLLGDLHADAFFLACLYTMRMPGSSIPSASSAAADSLRRRAGWGGTPVGGTRNSTSCTTPLPRISDSFPRI